jgi:paraquat-inducible protein B
LGLVSDARSVVSSEQVAFITASINEILKSLTTSAADLERVTAALSDADLVAQLRGTIVTASEVAENLKDASGGLPAIAKEIETLAGKASELPIEDLVASTNELVKTVDQSRK